MPGVYKYTVITSGPECNPTSIGGTITVQAAPLGGTLTSTSTCGGGGGTLTLAGNSPSVVQWESSTDGTTWTVISNTTISYMYSNVLVPTMFRVLVGNNCSTIYSSIATVSIHNYWTGGTSTDWNTASNWSDNKIPDASCPNVHIPGGTPHQPLINSGTVLVQNLQIDANATLTVAGATLQVSGSLNNQGGVDATTGTLEFNGSAAQNVATTTNIPVKNLLISNTDPTGVTLAGPVDVYTSVDFTNTGKTLNANGNLTIKSTETETAWVGDMTNHTINGDVTVERYINIGPGKHG